MLFILFEHDQDHVYHYSTFEGDGYGMFSTQEGELFHWEIGRRIIFTVLYIVRP